MYSHILIIIDYRPIQELQALKIIALNITIATAISIPMFVKQQLVNYLNFCGQYCAEDWGSDETGRSIYGKRLVFFIFFLFFIYQYYIVFIKSNVSILYCIQNFFLAMKSVKNILRINTTRNLLETNMIYVCKIIYKL